MSVQLRPYHQSGLKQWQRCPRRVWLQDVAQVEADGAVTGYAAPLGTAGHAGCELVCKDPSAERQQVLDTMLAAFDEALLRGQEREGRSFDPEAVQRALERIETEYLDLVLRLRGDPRLAAIEWIALEQPFEWTDNYGRTFRGTIDAVGRARTHVTGFGSWGRDPVDLAPGDWILVDWKFGRELELSRTALALNLQLAYYALAAARLFPGQHVRPFLAALRDLQPSQRPSGDDGQVIPKTIETLNPAYVAAFAGDRPITPELEKAAEQSRKRFRQGRENVPKRIKQPNPAWEAAQQRPRGPLFHEARLCWDVLRPTIATTIHEIEIAARKETPEAYPARGPVTGACRLCPFGRRCAELPSQPNFAAR